MTARLGVGGRRRAAAAVLVVAASGFAALPGRAEEARQGVAFHPSLRVTGVFDDNVLYRRRNPESDVGVWVDPRLEFEAERGALDAGLDVGADLRRYRAHPELDENFVDLAGVTELHLTPNLALNVRDHYAPEPFQLGVPPDQTGNRVRSNLAEAELRWRRPLSRENTVELAVRERRFDSAAFTIGIDSNGDGLIDQTIRARGDYNETAADAELRHGIGRYVLLYARGEARDRRFTELPDSSFRELSTLFGMRARRPRRFDYDVAVGWGRLDFRRRGHTNRVLARLRLRYELDHGLTLRGDVDREFTADLAGQEFVETSGRVGVEKRLGHRTALGVDGLVSSFRGQAVGGSSDLFGAVEVRLRRQLTRRLQAVLAYRYWINGGANTFDDFQQNRVTLELTYRR